MGKTHRKNQILTGTAAVLLCLSGCVSTDDVPPATTAPQSPQITTSAVETEGPVLLSSEPETAEVPETTQQPVPQQTAPLQTQPQTQPVPPEPETTEAKITMPETTTAETTEPTRPALPELDASLSQAVVNRTVTALQSLIPELRHESGWNRGTAVRMPVAPGASEDAMVNTLLTDVQLVLEQRDQSFVYSLSYGGISEDGSSHIFIFCYMIDVPVFEAPQMDPEAVVRQVTQNILSNTDLNVTTFDGSNYKACEVIREVPDFYSTQSAVDCLTYAVETEISTENLMETVYKEFKLVFDSREETRYVFLLYLR